MKKTLMLLCLGSMIVLFVSSFSGAAYAWQSEYLGSDYMGLATGCVTVQVTGDKATFESYSTDDKSNKHWLHIGTCNLSTGTYKFDFTDKYWVIVGDDNSQITNIRYSGGGCGWKCLNMCE
jgi:hypothetical protein